MYELGIKLEEYNGLPILKTPEDFYRYYNILRIIRSDLYFWDYVSPVEYPCAVIFTTERYKKTQALAKFDFIYQEDRKCSLNGCDGTVKRWPKV